jgi:acyl-CoA synthetase (AMP-forming)/AMP-acid ligase II
LRAIDYFDRGFVLAPDRAAFVGDGASFSYAEAADLSWRIAGAIRRRSDPGVPQQHVAVFSPNDPRAFLCVLAALRAGGVWVPINARNGVDENIFILRNCDCTWLFFHSSFAEHLPRLRQEVPGIRHYVCIDRDDDAENLTWADVAVASEPMPAEAPELRGPQRLCTILSTGGTTGLPKGVAWTDRTWETMVANFLAHMPCADPPVYLVAAPMTHAAGVIAFPLMAAGATSVILQKADPLDIMQAIERHRVTHLFLPPTVIYRMLAHPDVRRFDYSSLRYFIYSAAPMSVDKLKEAIEVFGPVMAQGYGQVEVPLMGTFLSPREHLEILASGDERRLRSCGRPALLSRVEIMSDDGRILPPGEAGEIVFSGNLVMEGYYKDPATTALASAGGWHYTGDIGLKDDAGYVYIVDRKKDMIITGGFNVYSTEIEQAILRHPSVQDCAVIGVPDDNWGEAVKAVVEPKPGQAVAPEEIIRLCRERLGGVKTPKTVEIWDTLPRSPVGKVLKREIRERYWTDAGRSI